MTSTDLLMVLTPEKSPSLIGTTSSAVYVVVTRAKPPAAPVSTVSAVSDNRRGHRGNRAGRRH